MRVSSFAWAASLSVLGLGGIVTGCVLVTGSTSGYEAAEAGVDSGPPPCLSSAGCENGDICCFGLAGISCQSSEAGTCGFGIQLCEGSSECPSSTLCVLQLCPVSSTSAPITVKACGLQTALGCEALNGNATSGDAGAGSGPDASVGDAGRTDGGGTDAGAGDASAPDSATDADVLDADVLDADAPDSQG
jgi:hypothetical protein